METFFAFFETKDSRNGKIDGSKMARIRCQKPRKNRDVFTLRNGKKGEYQDFLR